MVDRWVQRRRRRQDPHHLSATDLRRSHRPHPTAGQPLHHQGLRLRRRTPRGYDVDDRCLLQRTRSDRSTGRHADVLDSRDPNRFGQYLGVEFLRGHLERRVQVRGRPGHNRDRMDPRSRRSGRLVHRCRYFDQVALHPLARQSDRGLPPGSGTSPCPNFPDAEGPDLSPFRNIEDQWSHRGFPRRFPHRSARALGRISDRERNGIPRWRPASPPFIRSR
ncbi:unannotated protein [freshwater metagenome]|uniref:Unannotated protein n=1 Tax=freshwater metagenome TaxID=449393 RepID=A0A6J6GS41_9ZZZZ